MISLLHSMRWQVTMYIEVEQCERRLRSLKNALTVRQCSTVFVADYSCDLRDS